VPKQYSIQQFMSTVSLSGLSFSPDEQSILFSSNKSGVFNAYTIPIDGGDCRRLTHSTSESIHSISYFPVDDRILYTRDFGNVENTHLCVLEQNGRETVLTPGTRVRTCFAKWSVNSDSFYCCTNERDSRFFDVYKIDTSTYARTLIFENNDRFHFCDISESKPFCLFMKMTSREDSDLYLYNFVSKTMHCLTTHTGKVLYCLPYFDPCSRHVYYSTNKDSEFRYIERLDLETGQTECVERADFDVAYTRFTEDGAYRISLIGEEVGMRFKIEEHSSNTPIKLPQFPEGFISGIAISKSKRLMAFYVNGDCAPSDLYLYNFETQQISKLTSSLNPEIDAEDLVESQFVTYKSFDGLEIPSLLWKPHGADKMNKVPGLVWVHGGPGGRMAKGYKGRIQYLVNHGYAVLGINYRGSSGFGKRFFAADNLKHGRDPVLDCVEGKRFVASLDYIDASRIGIIGASFGGYMVLATLAFQPEEFAVGVDICGPSNWLKLMETLPPFWDLRLLYNKIGHPRDEEAIRALSPVFHADKIVKPLMILQGAKDPRCPRQQSDEIVAAIRKFGGHVDYLVFDDEAHGFRIQSNAIHAYQAVLNFLDQHLDFNRSAFAKNDSRIPIAIH
jgi:dipeptidyl aminopeptidase/acylaminoacyl peptidase